MVKKITLYRGLHAGHPDMNNALKGEVHPRGGNRSEAEHIAGLNDSRYTSWTTDREIAERFAGKGGLILKKEFVDHEYDLICVAEKFPNLEEVMAESEFLISGIIFEVTVLYKLE